MERAAGSDLEHLRQRLQAGTTLTACAQTVCDHLVAMGFPLPSLYLVRSGRLRCFGSSGYSQVRDGFPPVAGIIATTVRSGRPHIVDVRSSDIYIPAANNVETEVCVPIVLHGQTVGAVNIESPGRLPPETEAIACHVAQLYAERMEALGGIPRPTGWQYVADRAIHLVDIDNEREVFEAVLDTALHLSGSDTAMVVVGNRLDGFGAVAARGLIAHELASLSPASLTGIGQWVDGPLSVFTVGASQDEWFPNSEVLRDAGVGTVVVTALLRGDEQLGYLMVTDHRDYVPATDMVEQLELLGSLASSAITNARHLASLRDMARRDPLTGLGHNLAFSDALHLARERHDRYAVLAIDIDHFKDVNDTHGHEHGDRVLRELAAAMEVAVRVDDAVFRIGGDEFAAIVAVDTEDEAMAIAQRLSDAARRIRHTVSIGVAFNRHHGASDLYARADEALYLAKRSGRDRTVVAGGSDGLEGSDSLGGADGIEQRDTGTRDT